MLDLHLEVRGSGRSWDVLLDGKVLRNYTDEHVAIADCFAIERRLTPKILRPCLCCGTPIRSEGPHHRLCKTCRRRS